MSKYDDFIAQLKEETQKQEIVDLKQQIKHQFQLEQANNNYQSKVMINRGWLFKTVMSMVFLIVCCVVILVMNKNKTVAPIKPPVITSSLNETYAFEIMSAANLIYTNQLMQNANLNAKLRLANETELQDIARQIHEHYLTLQQLLYEDEVKYTITPSIMEGYSEQMVINLRFNSSVNLEYVIHYNKTIKEIEDDEETYDLQGIIIINNQTYQIIGETETEEDEQEIMIKVFLSDNHYFIIEQEIEVDEQEFVYTEYLNNHKVSEYALSYEVEGQEIELVIEYREGTNRGKVKAQLENNVINFEVELDQYQGKVQGTITNNQIRYYFETEKKEIFINFTNKTATSFVY